MRLILSFFLAAALLAASDLSSIKTIYVEDLGGAEGSDLIREKMINLLVESPYFSVTEKRDSADGVITGLAEMSKSEVFHGSANKESAAVSGGTSWDGTIAIRLVDRDGNIVWTKNAKPGRWSGSVSGSLAKNAVKDLEKKMKQALKNSRKDRD